MQAGSPTCSWSYNQREEFRLYNLNNPRRPNHFLASPHRSPNSGNLDLGTCPAAFVLNGVIYQLARLVGDSWTVRLPLVFFFSEPGFFRTTNHFHTKSFHLSVFNSGFHSITHPSDLLARSSELTTPSRLSRRIPTLSPSYPASSLGLIAPVESPILYLLLLGLIILPAASSPRPQRRNTNIYSLSGMTQALVAWACRFCGLSTSI